MIAYHDKIQTKERIRLCRDPVEEDHAEVALEAARAEVALEEDPAEAVLEAARAEVALEAPEDRISVREALAFMVAGIIAPTAITAMAAVALAACSAP